MLSIYKSIHICVCKKSLKNKTLNIIKKLAIHERDMKSMQLVKQFWL